MQYASEFFNAPALVSSKALSWQGIQMEQIYLPSAVIPPGDCANHVVVLHQVERPLLIRRRYGGRVSETVYQTGDLGLYPGGDHACQVDLSTPSSNVYITLDHQYLAQLVDRNPELVDFNLCERLKFTDPLLGQLCHQLLLTAGSQRALSQLYVESLANAFCHQLIAYHATYQRHRSYQPRLSAAMMARIDAYLEAHMETPVTLEVLASLANLSVFHFARLFKKATGLPPYQYVIQWKIRRAKRLLRQGDLPVVLIGDTLGFESLASFTAAFRRAVGCTPQQFQRHQYC